MRPDERRQALSAFAFLTGLVASHALLETARDALFLARLPAAHLPFMYLAIAAVSLLAARMEGRFSQALSPRSALAGWSAVAGGGTLAFFFLLPVSSRAAPDASVRLALYVLYVWSGVIATLVLVRFWSVLAESFSVTQAKRLYPFIGAGSVVGALFGSALASVLARVLAADQLLLVSGAGFFASSAAGALLASEPGASGKALPRLAPPEPAAGAEPVLELSARPVGWRGAAEARLIDDARLAARHPYVRRLALMIVVSAACVTLVDFAFKSLVAEAVPAAELGSFLGSVAFGLNALSLVCQVALAPRLLKRFDLGVALAVLPTLLAVGGIGLVAGAGLLAGLFVKGADGGLRYSLHRTTTELLYVPLPDRTRPRIKSALDGVGQRAGQAAASLLILGLAAVGASSAVMAAAITVLACLWVVSALDLRSHYVELLRTNVRDGSELSTSGFPALDLASLETLVATLDSHDDDEVLAALDILEREGKAHLVPALILHHPAEAVVERALGLFAHARRADAVRVVDRLLEHPSVRVRSAAIAVRALLAPDSRVLYQRLSLEESPEVRATIAVHLIASAEIVGAEAKERIENVLQHGRTSTKLALAEAIAWRQDHDFDDALVVLASAPEIEARLAAISAMAQHRFPSYLPALLHALGDERTRAAARHALTAYGDDGFRAALAALDDRTLAPPLRWELPRTLAGFEPQPAADVLLAQLTRETNGMVRYRIIRALETLVAKHPTLKLERATLGRVISETVGRAYRHLDERLTLEAGARAEPARGTDGHALLLDVLRGKLDNTRDRLLRLLALANPTADYARIRRSLRSPSAKIRANCVELVGNLLEEPLRAAVLGLIDDDLPDPERLAAAGTFHRPARLDYEGLLEHMLASESEALQDLIAFHVGELGLTRMRPLIAAVAQTDPARTDMARALACLDERPASGASAC